MDHTTLDKIKARLKLSEGELKHPYLDIKGKVTAGVGFNVDRKSAFTALDFWTKDRDGTERRATPNEKAAAYDKMIAAREANNGDHNRKAKSYNETTKVFLPDDVMEKTLDEKARDHVAGVQEEVGKDAFDRLNDSQKAAVTDIRYANGSLDDFRELTKAIKAGNAKKMAEESTFFINSKTGQRDEDRLKRNFQALSGLSQEESDKRLKEVLEKNDAARKNNPSNKPEPSDKSGGSGPPDGGPSGNAEKLSAGTDAGDDLENASPEARKFMDDLLKPGKPVDEIMLKDPRDLTEGEVKEIMIARMDAKTNDEREKLFKAEKGFFDHFFGDEPIGPDAAGRTMEPKPIRPIPETPKPVLTADGKPLDLGLKRIGRKIVRDAKSDGLANAVKRLQGGLNLLGEAKEPKASFEAFSTLKEDGVPGPKTRTGLRHAVAQLGASRIEEGLALGRFNQFAREGRKEGFGGLGDVTEKAFGLLFRGPTRTAPRATDRIETVALQETLNDLGKTQFGDDRFKPLKLDGLIGTKTTDAFSQLTGALGPEHVTKRFGEFLGFF